MLFFLQLPVGCRVVADNGTSSTAITAFFLIHSALLLKGQHGRAAMTFFAVGVRLCSFLQDTKSI